ncbi:hypothetical protein IRJ41_016670 [Triplophysa rosa]|uniref:Uncharacterized protein n=1 Tax=Triplophysa rosa TaxID=992332 RepID=A0A9W7X3B4_TRIRA|nr:hypothetical protein IRJ41_016670 [Triplophysa rosa]
MSSQVISTDNATVFIEINPQVVKDSTEREEKQGPYHNELLKGFLKAQPKALGTVQIIIGVMIFFIGIMLSYNYRRHHDIIVNSGITYWGSFIYITTGSLSVAAENKLRSCVVCNVKTIMNSL